MKRVAIYPGTFDPLTNGHLDIIQRASRLFDRLIVAVAAGVHKTPLLSLSARVAVCKEILSQFPNVGVIPLEGLLTDFVRSQHAHCIVRGLRAMSDFDRELRLAGTNRKMAPEIETLFLPASEENIFVSATFIREIYRLGGDISFFVPSLIIESLKKNGA